MATERSPGRRSDDGRRAELVTAASRVIAREGIAGATTRRIAHEAGVPTGLVHYWFAGKDELLEEVINDTLRPIRLALDEGGARLLGSRADLLAGLRSLFAVLQSDDRGRQIAVYEMTTWAMRKPDLQHVPTRQYAGYRELATTATAELAAATGAELPAPADVVGTFLAVLVDGLCLAWLADPEGTDVDAVLRLVSRLLSPYLEPDRDDQRADDHEPSAQIPRPPG